MQNNKDRGFLKIVFSRHGLVGLLALIAVAAVIFLPGLYPPPVDDEPDAVYRPAEMIDYDTVLAPGTPEIPGTKPSRLLVYENDEVRSVEVAGSWDQWSSRIPLEVVDDLWQLDVSAYSWPFGHHLYRFILDGEWEQGASRNLFINADGLLERPASAINSVRQTEAGLIEVFFNLDMPAHEKLRARLSPQRKVARHEWVEPGRHLKLHMEEKPLFHEAYTLELIVEGGGVMRYPLDARPAIDLLLSERPLGAHIDHQQQKTVFRVFAPRAQRVEWVQYQGPFYGPVSEGEEKPHPLVVASMARGEDGVWETVRAGIVPGIYYSYRIFPGSVAGGDGTAYIQTADPYARAVAREGGNSILVDVEATNDWYSGVQQAAFFVTPRPADTVVYEFNLGRFTAHPSTQVDEAARGTYQGLGATRGHGTGLDHLNSLGVELIELQPVAEAFGNGETAPADHLPVFPFAPSSVYATEPLSGSGYYECRQMTSDLHEAGFGVIIGVSLDRARRGSGFAAVDADYYLRVAPPERVEDINAPAMELRTEAPMVRRLMRDVVQVWMREFRVDGFRLIGGTRIDPIALDMLSAAARRENSRVILMGDTSVAGGGIGQRSARTGWLLRNIEWRERTLDYLLQTGNGTGVREAWCGNHTGWVHSLCGWNLPGLTTRFSERMDRGMFRPEDEIGKRNRLAATLLLTMPGIALMAEGQEFVGMGEQLPSDAQAVGELSPLNWLERRNPTAQAVMRYYRDLISIRKSSDGRSFRPGSAVTPELVSWIPFEEPSSLGYFVFGLRHGVGADWCVLLNASERPIFMEVPFPAGRWVLVADGDRIDLDGLDLSYNFSRASVREVLVSRWGAYIFKRQ